jgi:hypothetical protein
MYYHRDLLDLYRGRMSYRKVAVYVSQLPPESATMTAIRLDAPGQPDEEPDASRFRWSASDMLLAQAIDEVRILRWALIKVNSGKNAQVPFPPMVPRPGVKAQRRKRLTAEQRRMLDPRLRPGTGHVFHDGRRPDG